MAGARPGISPSVVSVLRVVRHDLGRVLAPELQSKRAKSMAGILDQLLALVIDQEDSLPAARAEREAALLTLIGGRAGDDAEQALATTLGQPGASGRPRDRATVTALLEIEEAYEGALAGSKAAGRDMAFRLSGGEAIAVDGGADIAVTPERLTEVLRRHLPEAPAIRCTALELIQGGNSKDTTLFSTEGAPGLERLVMRRDLPLSSFGDTVVDEHPILATLHARGLAVARPILCEPGPSVLGAPFMISERVAGVTAISLAGDGGEALVPVAHDLARLLAQLHALDIATIPVRHRDLPPARCAPVMIDGLERLWREKALAPSPLMAFAFAWLRANVPAAPPRLSLVHGDAGFHNILTENGRVAALLDWEFAHAGDPAEDLAYLEAFVAPIMPYDVFLATYRAAGGQPWDAARLGYFGALAKLRIAVGCYSLQHTMETGARALDGKSASTGLLYGRRFLIDSVRQMLAAPTAGEGNSKGERV